MTTTVTETSAFERVVKFQLTDAQIDEAKKGAARKLAQEVKIHGFRPGKAPLPIIEATVGKDRVRQEAIEDLLNPVLSEVLTAEEIEPAINPELESVDDIDGGVEVEVKVTLWPTVELPNYKGRNIEVTNPEVTDEDLEEQSRRMLERVGKHTPGPVLVAEGHEMSHAEEVAAQTGGLAFWGVGESMEPLYAANTAIVVAPVRYDEIKKGMTVVYRKANGRCVAHAVIGASSAAAVWLACPWRPSSWRAKNEPICSWRSTKHSPASRTSMYDRHRSWSADSSVE